MDIDEIRAGWVGVNRALGADLRAVSRIRERFSGIGEVFRARPEILTTLGIDGARVRRLRRPGLRDEARREIERLEKRGVSVLIPEDQNYPDRLREIFDPPAVLYCEGDPALLNQPAVAVVGSRKPSAYGRAVAEKLAEDLAGCGLTVISGMARGIDSVAHWGALKGGRTVAVLGSGIERIYPRENTRLFQRVVASGAVISELPPEAPPLGFHFPMRNRIISGLSMALVVVEAARRSGSLITARLALEQNREVMAVPGNVTSEMSGGTNWLIGNGAKPVSGWRDVVEELPPSCQARLKKIPLKKEPPVRLDAREKNVLRLLETDGERHIDDIVEAGGLAVSEALSILLALELKGMVAQRPGKYFQRKL